MLSYMRQNGPKLSDNYIRQWFYLAKDNLLVNMLIKFLIWYDNCYYNIVNKYIGLYAIVPTSMTKQNWHISDHSLFLLEHRSQSDTFLLFCNICGTLFSALHLFVWHTDSRTSLSYLTWWLLDIIQWSVVVWWDDLIRYFITDPKKISLSAPDTSLSLTITSYFISGYP